MEDDPHSLPEAKPMRDFPRKRFSVELKRDEMNVVSWKKLTEEAQQATQSEEMPQPDNTSRTDEKGKKGAEEDDGGATDYYDSDDDSELNERYKTKSKSREEDKEPSSPPASGSSNKKRKKKHMDEIPKKRAKKRVSRMQTTSPANEAMDKVVGHDMDEVEDTNINKELGSSSIGVLGSDESKEMGNASIASASNVNESDPEFSDMLEKAFLDLESAVAESSAQQAEMTQAVAPPKGKGSKKKHLPPPKGKGSKKKHLPPGVRRRLNGVGNLVIEKYGEVPDDIFERLYGILKHITARRNLRRILDRMVAKHHDALQKSSEAQVSSEQDTDEEKEN